MRGLAVGKDLGDLGGDGYGDRHQDVAATRSRIRRTRGKQRMRLVGAWNVPEEGRGAGAVRQVRDPPGNGHTGAGPAGRSIWVLIQTTTSRLSRAWCSGRLGKAPLAWGTGSKPAGPWGTLSHGV